MVQENEYFAFIRDKWKILPAANCMPCSNVVLLRASLGAPLGLLWLSYRTLKWIRSAFEEVSKVMRGYTLAPRNQFTCSTKLYL